MSSLPAWHAIAPWLFSISSNGLAVLSWTKLSVGDTLHFDKSRRLGVLAGRRCFAARLCGREAVATRNLTDRLQNANDFQSPASPH